MPYTALQTLGYLVRCSNWERIYNINRTPYRKGRTTNCRLFAYRARYKKSGRRVVVLKRTGPRKIACGCGACYVCGRFIDMFVDDVEKSCPLLRRKAVGDQPTGKVEE